MSEYRIIIEKLESGNIGGLQPSNPTARKDSSAVKTATSFIIGKQIGKNLLNFASSRVEMYTGDSQAQANVNMTMKMIGYGIGFATNPALTAVALATDIATQWADSAYKHKWEMIGIEDRVNLLGGLSYGRNRSK